jgi:hypothetical protein
LAESQSALDSHRSQSTGSHLRDGSVARFYAVYLHIVAPSLTIYRPHNNSLFTQELAMEALHDLRLLHASLRLSTHRVTVLLEASLTPSYKHYAYSPKRIARSLAKDRQRLKPSTLRYWASVGHFLIVMWEKREMGPSLDGSFAVDMREIVANTNELVWTAKPPVLDHRWPFRGSPLATARN